MRIIGNGGADGEPRHGVATTKPIWWASRIPARLQPLADGGQFQVPANVTVMIDAGVDIKMRRANLNAGTTPQGLVVGGGSIQVLGTPGVPVVFTSYADDTVGGDTDGPSSGPQGGDYGGIVYRDDSDHERDYLHAGQQSAGPGHARVSELRQPRHDELWRRQGEQYEK